MYCRYKTEQLWSNTKHFYRFVLMLLCKTRWMAWPRTYLPTYQPTCLTIPNRSLNSKDVKISGMGFFVHANYYLGTVRLWNRVINRVGCSLNISSSGINAIKNFRPSLPGLQMRPVSRMLSRCWTHSNCANFAEFKCVKQSFKVGHSGLHIPYL